MPRLKRRRRGTLHVLAGMMVLSALLRLSNGVGLAMAEDGAPLPPDPPMAAQTEVSANPDLIAALQARDAELTRREAQIADRMQALRLAETEITDQITALEAAEESLRATMALAQEASRGDLQNLATVYENMKPRDAAALFAQMPPGFAAGFLGLMPPEAAAPIMSSLPPDAAYSISVMLAGRNADVPTE